MFAIVDCNNFYASCQRAFDPKLIGKPIVVLSNNDGCIIARSDEAKPLVAMGAPIYQVEKELKQKGVHIFSSNYPLYGDMSERVMNTLQSMVNEVEIYSVDEAFLHLNGHSVDSLEAFATEIRQRVMQWTGIPVSIGVAPTRTLAKVANHIAKKHKKEVGVHIIPDRQAIDNTLKDFPVERIWGIGRNLTAFLQSHNIHTGLELAQMNDNWIRQNLTVVGLRKVKELRGFSCMGRDSLDGNRKAIASTRSFGKETDNLTYLKEAIATFTTHAVRKLRRQKSCTRYLTVFLRTNRFKNTQTRKGPYYVVELPVPTSSTTELIKHAVKGIEKLYCPGIRYKRAGIFLSGLVPESQVQTRLFDTIDRDKQKSLDLAMDYVNEKMGRNKVRSASEGFDKKWKIPQARLSPAYTTQWNEILEIEI